MKISVIATVLNEAQNIEPFLDSLLAQTKKPQEIIVVDAGSTDGTYETLKTYARKYARIQVYQEKRANRSRGRNIAIQKAKGNIIFSTDAGCIIDKNWIKELATYFPKHDAVAGVSKPITKNDFEAFQAISTVKQITNLARMSGRNTAYKKECWKKVGGYPEASNTGEDHRFHINLTEAGYNIQIHNKPLVAWEMRPTLKTFYKQFYGYGRGDRQQGNLIKKTLWKNVVMILAFWAYTITLISYLFSNPYISLSMTILPIGILELYAAYQVGKTGKISALWWVPTILLTRRIGYILGATFK